MESDEHRGLTMVECRPPRPASWGGAASGTSRRLLPLPLWGGGGGGWGWVVGRAKHRHGDLVTLFFFKRNEVFNLQNRASCAGLQLLEEVVALVVHKDEGWEVLHLNLPDGFHAQFWIFHTLDALDA